MVSPTQIGKNKVDFVDLRVSKDLMQLPAGSLGWRFGVEYRKEKSGFEALPITAQLGSLGIDPDSDTSGSRKMAAAYAELNIPVIKDLELPRRWPLRQVQRLRQHLQPEDRHSLPADASELLLRGSANTGFRAPTLYEIYQPQSLTFTSDNYDDPLLCPGGVAVPARSAGVVCDQQVLQRNVGPVPTAAAGRPLEPEKSQELHARAWCSSRRRTSAFGVDYWQIKIKNLISGLPEQAVFGEPDQVRRPVRALQPAAGHRRRHHRADDIDACVGFPGIGYDPIAYIDTPTENLGKLKTQRSGPVGGLALGRDGDGLVRREHRRYLRHRSTSTSARRAASSSTPTGRYSDNAPVFRWQHVADGDLEHGCLGSDSSRNASRPATPTRTA